MGYWAMRYWPAGYWPFGYWPYTPAAVDHLMTVTMAGTLVSTVEAGYARLAAVQMPGTARATVTIP